MELRGGVIRMKEKQANGKTPFWKNKKFRMGTTATVLTAVFVAAVILVNVVVGILHDRYPMNIDLTSDKLYTLSEESEKFAKDLKNKVEIIVFGSESAYKDANNDIIARQLYEFTKAYEALSSGKVTVKFIDGTLQPQLYNTYKEKYNVESGDVLFLGEKDQNAIASSSDMYEYDETMYQYYGEFVMTSSLVEAIIANNVQTVCRETQIEVMILTGHVESEGTLKDVQSALRKNGYTNISFVDITTAQELSKTANLAFICAPGVDYTDAELNRLSDWLLNGGKRNRDLVVFADDAANCPQLYDYLENEHGIKVHDALVRDTNFANLFQMSSYYATYATMETLAFTNNMSEDLRVKTPNTRPLSSTWSTDTEGAGSYVQVLAAFNSETAAKAPIGDKGDGTYEALGDANGAVLLTTQEHWDSEDESMHQTNVAVFGSELFAYYEGNNQKLVVNMINKINEVENSVAIPALSLQADPMQIDAETAITLGVIFAIVLPLVTLAAGLIVFLRRRHL